MGVVRVDPEGLAARAARCEAWAAELTAAGDAPATVLPVQATSAAVSAADAVAASARAAMATRMRATAAKLVAGSNAYVSTEEASAAELNTVET